MKVNPNGWHFVLERVKKLPIAPKTVNSTHKPFHMERVTSK